ncbi:MAG: phenylalanine--tRNA ligase subunit beta [Treponemataceae bacterium]
MPKIEVNENLFYDLVGRRYPNRDVFEEALTCAKAELDEDSDKKLPEGERILKIELNDTNRPDLWSTAGCARQLRVHGGGKKSAYDFFSKPGAVKKATRKVVVEASVQKVRPYLAGFVASGKAVSDESLKDMIQTQEKVCWNFGRKRRSVSMGLYRIAIIQWPVKYKAVDPDSVKFVPLQWDRPMTLREILKEHPKGKEYAFILENEQLHPLLTDVKDAVLSYPPIINSADLGAVKVGDTDLFIELTGTDQQSVTLAANLMACDFADQGYTIEPVEVEYAYDTPFGRKVTTPYYFQESTFCSLARVEKFLGEKLSADECVKAIELMDCTAQKATDKETATEKAVEGIRVYPAPYRNDFLHAADVVEDVMIGRTMKSFKPMQPRDFTIGRLTPITYFSRKAKESLIGLGFQEMIYNYLGSKKDYVDKMLSDGSKIVRISNPMSENFEYVRDSVLPCLMMSESVSGNAVYPHRIFEVGKVAYLDDRENYGVRTRQHLGFLDASADANFNTVSSRLQAIFYYLNREYTVEEAADPHFIPGRAAAIMFKGEKIGVFGELHPALLEAWNVTMPCTAAEFDLDALL